MTVASAVKLETYIGQFIGRHEPLMHHTEHGGVGPFILYDVAFPICYNSKCGIGGVFVWTRQCL